MKFTYSGKDVELNPQDQEYLEAQIEKLKTRITTFKDDVPKLSVVIKQQKRNTQIHEIHKEINNHKPPINNPFYYAISIDLVLPRKPLVVKHEAKSVHEVLKSGFASLFKELTKYKAKHFKSRSDYKDKSTIRPR